MNTQEIKRAVDLGLIVHWSTALYTVIKDSKGQYLISCTSGAQPNCIGLTWADDETFSYYNCNKETGLSIHYYINA